MTGATQQLSREALLTLVQASIQRMKESPGAAADITAPFSLAGLEAIESALVELASGGGLTDERIDTLAAQAHYLGYYAGTEPRIKELFRTAGREALSALPQREPVALPDCYLSHTPPYTLDTVRGAYQAGFATAQRIYAHPAVERATIERAAKVCDQRAAEERDAGDAHNIAGDEGGAKRCWSYAAEATACAAAIRALAGNAPKAGLAAALVESAEFMEWKAQADKCSTCGATDRSILGPCSNAWHVAQADAKAGEKKLRRCTFPNCGPCDRECDKSAPKAGDRP